MVSYAEKQGKEIINWDKELSGKITPERMEELMICSDSWSTCPTGQLSNVIRRDSTGEPKDDIMTSFGRKFTDVFKSGDIASAKHYIGLIKTHGKFLVEQVEAEKLLELDIFYKESGKKRQ